MNNTVFSSCLFLPVEETVVIPFAIKLFALVTKECSLQHQRRRICLDWSRAAGTRCCHANSTITQLVCWSSARLTTPSESWCSHSSCPLHPLSCKTQTNQSYTAPDDLWTHLIPITFETILCPNPCTTATQSPLGQSGWAGRRSQSVQPLTSPTYPLEIIPHALFSAQTRCFGWGLKRTNERTNEVFFLISHRCFIFLCLLCWCNLWPESLI